MPRGSGRATLRTMNDNLCLLRKTVGQFEVCPKGRCAFWEAGGAVLAGGCTIERLGLTPEVERTPGFASWLLDLRGQLEAAATEADRHEVHRLFDRLVPPELRD
jgi:hypothetical protein